MGKVITKYRLTFWKPMETFHKSVWEENPKVIKDSNGKSYQLALDGLPLRDFRLQSLWLVIAVYGGWLVVVTWLSPLRRWWLLNVAVIENLCVAGAWRLADRLTRHECIQYWPLPCDDRTTETQGARTIHFGSANLRFSKCVVIHCDSKSEWFIADGSLIWILYY